MMRHAGTGLIGLLLVISGAAVDPAPPDAPAQDAPAATAAPAPAAPAPAAPAPAAPAPAAPASAPVSDPTSAATPDTTPTLDEVMCELEQLRTEVLRLQQTVDMYLNGAMEDLKAENNMLRDELRELYQEKGAPLPAVPTPMRKLLEDILQASGAPETTPDTAAGAAATDNAETSPKGDAKEAEDKPTKASKEDSPEAAEPKPQQPPAEEAAQVAKDIAKSGYAVIAEWGRSPEDAAKLNRKATSVKGMICVVAAATSENDLADLGKKLRSQYDAYDNINIEVFDDLATATTFRDTYTATPGHHVLSVSKHRASGRDVILLIQGGVTKEIPANGQP